MLLNDSRSPKPGHRLALFATAFSLIVIVLGAFTRLVDAGLGCPDWPGCYGHLLWPIQEHNVLRAETRFPDFPVDQSKTWPEMVHRYLAGTLGLLIVGLAALAWRRHSERGYPFRLPVFLLFLVVWQAIFGMWTVTLKLWPQIVTLHLLGGFTIFALLWLLTLRLQNRRWSGLGVDQYGQLQRARPWVLVGMTLLVVQVLLGGWTTSNYAALACADLPTCHGHWVPPMDFRTGFNVFQEIGPNYLGGQMDNEARVAIQYTHRMGALVVTLFTLGFVAWLWRVRDRRVRQLLAVLLVVTLLQVGLGLSNIIFMVPLQVAVAHNAVGALLLAVWVTVAARIWMVDRPAKKVPEVSQAA